MPKPYPQEFRDDVVKVARHRPEGTTLEMLGRRAVMSGFHGMFSLGSMVGAGAAALMLRASISAPLQLALVGGAVALSVALSSRGMLDAHPKIDAREAHFAWPSGPLLVSKRLITCCLQG